MTYEEWFAFGIENGFCTPEFCYTHETPFMHEDETELFDKGEDTCIKVVRLGSYNDWAI